MKGSIPGGINIPAMNWQQQGGGKHGQGPQHGQQGGGMWGGMNGMPQGLFGGSPGMQPPNIQLPRNIGMPAGGGGAMPPMFQAGQMPPVQPAAPRQFALGGKLTHMRSMKLRNPKVTPHMHGLFHSSVPGRTDQLHIAVPHDSYIVPADVVSGLGEGNTLAGGKALDKLTGGHAPYGTSMGKSGHFAQGGLVPIVVAGGEYHIHPDAVKRLGKGNTKHGHQILDAFVKHVRSKTAEKMQKLPGPKK